MMGLIDARIPHFRRDEGLFRGRPLIVMKAQISPEAKGFLLALVVGFGLPRHSWLVVPLGKDSGLTVGVDRQIGMKPLALAFGSSRLTTCL